MNVKKTIASIAAIAMVASATSLAPLFTGTSISAEGETETIGAETPETEENIEDELAENNDDLIAPQALPAISAPAVTNLSGADATPSIDGNTVTINLTKTGDTVSGGSTPELADGNHTDPYTNGAFRLFISGNFTGYTMPKKENDADNTYYKPDDNATGATNLSANGIVLYLSADAVFGTDKPDTVTYKVPLSTDGGSTVEYITIVLKNVTVDDGDDDGDETTLTVGTTATVDAATVKNGTAAAAVTEVAGVKTVTVTLTPDEGKTLGGDPQEGNTAAGTPQNYHITLPITGLTTDWVFDSSSQYGYDDTDNKDWNIAGGELKLWLPVVDGNTCTVVLKNGDETLTIKFKTVFATTTDPGEEGPEGPEGPGEEEEVDEATKLAPAIAAINTIEANWDFDSWVNISELGSGQAEAVAGSIQAALRNDDWGFGIDGAEVTLLDYTTASGSDLVAFTIKVKVGTAETTKVIVLKCKDDRVVDVVTPAPAPVVPYYPPVVSNNPVNPSISSVKEAASAVEISAAKQKEVTVNAAETDVTPSMVKAFIKNKNTKTLTLKYSSSLKISIDKDSISDASAKLDFSVSGKKFLSSKLLKKLNAEKVVQLDFVNAGKLEGVDKVTVKSRVGANYIGKTVTIYEYKNGKLVKVGKATVNGAGIVKFNTNRLGQFVLAVE